MVSMRRYVFLWRDNLENWPTEVALSMWVGSVEEPWKVWKDWFATAYELSI